MDEETFVGREQREKLARELAVVDATIGPVRQHDVYRGMGCPKCGAPSQAFARAFCPGKRDGFQGQCQTFGEHLHGMCGMCKFQWREETLDAAANRDRMAEELSKLVP